jgi:hypothetical protein
MAQAMHPGTPIELTPEAAERRLRDEVARADRTIASARPVLRQLLTEDGAALFTDETVARVRAMVRDVARQLLEAQAEAAGAADLPTFVASRLPRLTSRLIDHAPFLAHVHALALEGEWLERLRLSAGLDPVLTPAIEHIAAGEDAAGAALAMALLAAQARFVQHHHRMELALRDLPGELFHAALMLLRADADDDAAVAGTEQPMRTGYDESAARPALLDRFALTLDRAGYGTLAIERAGLSVFSAALALAVQEERETAILTLALSSERLAVALRAAGVAPHGVETQLAILHPGNPSSEDLALTRADRAADVLRHREPEGAL